MADIVKDSPNGPGHAGGLNWERDGRHWPHHDASRFVESGGINWHVQTMGAGPALLLIHGTGASTHSWRDLLQPLARDFSVISVDLPGHGFTETPGGDGMSLPGMARLVIGLLRDLGSEPVIGVGHSAGAAVLLRMSMEGFGFTGGVISLNGALLPFQGVAGKVFSPLAKMIVVNPLASSLFAWRARSPSTIRRLLESTGSEIGGEGSAFYRQLATDPKHIGAALKMMANWDLETFESRLHRLDVRLLLVAGDKDGTVRPEVSRQVLERVRGARLLILEGLGHLAHEESPDRICDLIRSQAVDWGVLGMNS